MDNNVRDKAVEVGNTTLAITNTVAKGIRGRFGKLVSAAQGIGVKYDALAAAGIEASAKKVQEDLQTAEAQLTEVPLTFEQQGEALQVRLLESGNIENLAERAKVLRQITEESDALADRVAAAAKAEQKQNEANAKAARKLLKKNPNAGNDLAEKMRQFAQMGRDLAETVEKLPIVVTPVVVVDEPTTVVEPTTPVS